MRAMVLKEPGLLIQEDRERAAARHGEALVRVRRSGICGTDLKIYNGAISVGYPLVMGHEAVGEVVAGNGNGGGGRITGRVIVDPAYFCADCFHCRAGQMHLCPNGGLIGRDRDGGFADYVAVPRRNVHALPDEIGDDEAPLIQVLTTCLHGHRKVDIFPGEAVVVLGLGVTGQLHIQLAKARGAHPVIGITRSAWKRELAERLGADLTAPPGADAKAMILAATGGRGADLVIESVGQVATLAQAIEMTRTGGRLLPFGIISEKEGALPFYDLYFKELEIVNSRVAKSRDFPACIDLVQRGVVKLKPLISHTLPVDDLAGALAMLADENSNSMKIIMAHA
ncbi:MAG TPA: zinc-binding dehydrogenase [Alphaproteobacteria bacterium]|jgi:2-desacetyl-2-hydroxyethyl bacteriochlorophyllide A dehydrogenase|nr:zinc-binding dehydrogenase [Alphaproteobacteria bacterium]